MLYTLTTSSWTGSFSPVEQKSAMSALEAGKIIYLPSLSFELSHLEKTLLTPTILEGNSKNISFDPKAQTLKGSSKITITSLRAIMTRFFNHSQHLVNTLIPHYQDTLLTGRTSFRPVEIVGRKTSLLKDDTRLHVDAFPATPNQGKRILRVFTNVNPMGKSRLWQVGESFEAVVKQFISTLRSPMPGVRALLSSLKITKSYRSLYDHYMLSLHNQMKKSNDYQNTVKKTAIHFPAGATWMVMTDCVSHAALSGQFLLEQTFYLPVTGMYNPEKSPLCILERALDQKLIST